MHVTKPSSSPLLHPIEIDAEAVLLKLTSQIQGHLYHFSLSATPTMQGHFFFQRHQRFRNFFTFSDTTDTGAYVSFSDTTNAGTFLFHFKDTAEAGIFFPFSDIFDSGIFFSHCCKPHICTPVLKSSVCCSVPQLLTVFQNMPQT